MLLPRHQRIFACLPLWDLLSSPKVIWHSLSEYPTVAISERHTRRSKTGINPKLLKTLLEKWALNKRGNYEPLYLLVDQSPDGLGQYDIASHF